MRLHGLAPFLILFAGCSSDGGSDLMTPTIASASFVGAGASPAAGDVIHLLMSRDVELTAQTLDDDDLQLSDGSVGTIVGTALQLDSRTVQVRLGAGTTFTPGTTTVVFTGRNDAVVSRSGLPAQGGTPRVVEVGDGDRPTILGVTLNGVSDTFNGRGAAGGVLMVPRNGFSVDIQHTDGTSGVDRARTQITTNTVVETPLGALPAGTDITGWTTMSTAGNVTSFRIDPEIVFPDGFASITGVVVDQTGMSSEPQSFVFKVTDATSALRPTERTQVWYLDTTRDLESYDVDGNGVNVIGGANGRSDLEDLFEVVGLYGGGGLNRMVMSGVENAILERLQQYCFGVDAVFTFDRPGPPFPSEESVGYPTFPYSQICIAGAADYKGTSSLLGLAIFDPNNTTQDNDCLADVLGERLGVFVHTLVHGYMTAGSTTTYRLTFDPLTPWFGGTPIGNDSLDIQRMTGQLNDARTVVIENAIDRMGYFIASVVAHECGHSMGLVQDGAMPVGLFGGDATNFPGSTSGHIDTSFQYTGFAMNLMSPFIDFDGAIDPGSSFNHLNLTYLREQVLYGNK